MSELIIDITNDVEAVLLDNNQTAEFRFMRDDEPVLEVNVDSFKLPHLKRYALLYCMQKVVESYADKSDATVQEQFEAASDEWERLAR